MKATYNGTTIAESDATIVVESNHYFPAESLKREHFRQSEQTTECGWKGTANYYDVVVGDTVNPDAAWYYKNPKAAAQEIAGYVAFWKGVEVSGKPSGDGPELEAGECQA